MQQAKWIASRGPRGHPAFFFACVTAPVWPGRGCEREISLKMRHLLKAAFPSGTGSLPSSSLYRGWFSSPDITGWISTVPSAGEKNVSEQEGWLTGWK